MKIFLITIKGDPKAVIVHRDKNHAIQFYIGYCKDQNYSLDDLKCNEVKITDKDIPRFLLTK